MVDLASSTEATTKPQLSENEVRTKRQERGRVVRQVVSSKAENPGDKAPATKQALGEYRKIQNLNEDSFVDAQGNAKVITYDRTDPAKGEKDFLLPGFDHIDANGKKVTYGPNEWRIAQIVGVDDDGDLQCVIEDQNGNQLDKALPKDMALDALMVALRPDFEDAVAADPTAAAQLKGHLDSRPQVGLLAPTDEEFLDEAKLTALEDKYSVTKPDSLDDELKAMEKELPTRQQVEVTIGQAIKALEEKGLIEKLSADELKLLGKLRLDKLADADAAIGIAFKDDALVLLQDDAKRKLKDGDASMQHRIDDLQKLRDGIKDEVFAAEAKLTQLVKGGGVSKEQFDKWLKLSETEGMAALLLNPDFDNLIAKKGKDISTAIFGKEMTLKDLKEMLKGTQLPPELQKALDDGDETSLWKILLVLAAGVVASPFLATTAAGIGIAVSVPTMAAKG